jgi:transcriptional regulator with XRE-family HTH domain
VSDIERALRTELRDPEYSEGYAESFLNAYVATQIKVIREQREMTQAQVAEAIGTTQAGISRIENVNYSSWSIRTLIKLARAFGVRLKVSFEPFGTLPDEVMAFNRDALQRVKREEDPLLTALPPSPLAANDSRGGNLVPINIYKILGGTADGNKKPAMPSAEEAPDYSVAYAEFAAGGGSQPWR